ncbi:DNA mismatch repair protein MutS [Chloroflexota bacterium]
MSDNVTPIRQQYLRIKQQYPDAILLFRLGDFYETFDQDARLTSQELEITLTSREMGKGNKVPMAGIPFHALDNYLGRLVNRGYRVAICEQMTKPGEQNGIVEREVVRLVTPGTVVEPNLLNAKTNNYLAGLVLNDEMAGLAWVDITTSEFFTEEIPVAHVNTELERIQPRELIVPADAVPEIPGLNPAITEIEGYYFKREIAERNLLAHFRTLTLEGYGCADKPLATGAAGAIIHYLGQTQKGLLTQLTGLTTTGANDHMMLDAHTQRNLELFRPGHGGGKGASLLSVLDKTKTAMGGRLLRRWLGQPLLDIAGINRRLDAVGWFVEQGSTRAEAVARLEGVADLERLVNRVRSVIAGPKELIALKVSLEVTPVLRALLEAQTATEKISWLIDELKPCREVVELITEAIIEEPSTAVGDGDVIADGLSEELDSLRLAARNARNYIVGLETKERERTGIKNLRIGFNNVFGYYIEISKGNLPQVPEEYIRKQTLANGERYFTPQLKEYESLILNAREKIKELEHQLFERVCRQIAIASERILCLASAVAELDIHTSLAEVAVYRGYSRPELDNGTEIAITGGRHPVVEQSLGAGAYVPNDVFLSGENAQIIILTGPNMSGKSTYLRQVALIVLMAQVGSFVPANQAKICVTDRIFTRIGARDDLAIGQSTFMVEMVETANILNNATNRSLIILDEVGRGTSTYDGLSIARAVTEYLHNAPNLGAKTIFATHYHEMTEMADRLPRVKNFNVSVVEEGGRVVFLHRIIPGGADRSYGIHVAELAGIPASVLKHAREVLNELETSHRVVAPPVKRRRQRKIVQYSFFGDKPDVLKNLAGLDVNTLSPIEALAKLAELQQRAEAD